MKERRLWDKGEGTDERMLRFTVGSDPIVDRELLPFDCVASAAHARMLGEIDILSKAEVESSVAALKSLYQAALRGEIAIPVELEDCHTTIEARLTETLGELGKKIHTGRSRNDQVLTAMRLYLRDATVSALEQLFRAAEVFLARAVETVEIPMPGYTHTQPAMPSSVGMWFHSYGEALIDLIPAGLNLLSRMNKSPLGAASGFDVPLPLNRAYTAELLGFAEIHRSVIDAQNSRGRYERELLFWLAGIAGVFEKFASDCVLYLSKEFGFFSLPDSFTTGSSIMPQKKNPDIFELMRARAAQIRAAGFEVEGVTAKLPGSFHRDFQATKEPTMRGVAYAEELLAVVPSSVAALQINEAALKEKLYPELYSTYEAYRLVAEGMPFRDAYRQAAEATASGKIDPKALGAQLQAILERARMGISGADRELKGAVGHITAWRDLNDGMPGRVFG